MAFSTTKITTTFAGQYKIVAGTVSPDGATGSIDLSTELTAITAVACTFIKDATATCYTISTSISGTTLTVKLWKAGAVAADTGYLDFSFIVVGY